MTRREAANGHRRDDLRDVGPFRLVRDVLEVLGVLLGPILYQAAKVLVVAAWQRLGLLPFGGDLVNVMNRLELLVERPPPSPTSRR